MEGYWSSRSCKLERYIGEARSATQDEFKIGPISYVEAISNSDTNHCHSAMDLEMNPMYKNYV